VKAYVPNTQATNATANNAAIADGNSAIFGVGVVVVEGSVTELLVGIHSA